MPRIAPTPDEFVELDNGEYLRVAEAALRIFDRQDWLRKNRARARIKVLVDKIGIDAVPRARRRGARGRVGRRARLHGRPRADEARARRGGRTPPRPPASHGSPERRPLRVRPLRRRRTSRPQRQEGFSTIEVKVYSRRPVAGAVPRPRRRSCASSPAATRAPASSRTWSCAGCATRPIYDVWERLSELGLGEAGARRDHRRRQLPRHRQLQARDHQLDGPQQGDPGAARPRCRSTDPLTKRIHIKMSGCPNGCGQHHIGEHRLLRRLAEGRRAPGARLHPPHRRQLRGRRGRASASG